ncbi:type IV secretory system conjugative DNA transfer family protein [Kitasatospora sp. NPDC059577]|uniref:type IV secretory system conjugative DNA transfer family protein n=1 Tax=Kitasatospora sp. NPDC059577 TaxID=3346873 RepID=UPI0036A23899
MGSDVLIGHEGLAPVYLRNSNRTAHVAILGKSGYGKTTLLEHLVLADMRDGTGAIVIDAHGDLTRDLVALAPFKSSDRPDDPSTRVILVEPNTEQPFGLNLYECPPGAKSEVVENTVGQVLEIFHKLMGTEGAGLRPIIDPGFRNTARVLIANQLTMAELPLLYTDQAFRHDALRRVTNQYVRQYWQDYEAATSQKRAEKSDPILNKVGRFLEDDRIRLMVSQTKSTIPFQDVMDNGGTLILNLASLDRESVSFLGMVFLSVLSNVIQKRDEVPKHRRRRVHLYLDEYGRFATSTTRRLIDEARKYEIGITIAHQNLAQTPDREALSVETLITFQLSADDAHEVAGTFDCTPIRTKRVARQRTEPQYREWEEEVWDSDVARRYYEELKSRLEAIESEYRNLDQENAVAAGMLREIRPLPRKHRFDSLNGTVYGVYIIHDLPFGLRSPEIDMHQLVNILARLHSKYGRQPRGDELSEAHQWLDAALARCEEIYRNSEVLLPQLREELNKLKSKTTSLYEQHASLEPRKEHTGDTPVKDGWETVYDYIDELDQTHADRQAEIANILTQLPKYVMYGKVTAADGKPHEYTVKTLPPASLPTYEDYEHQTETAEHRREREERERSYKLRGLDRISTETLFELPFGDESESERLRRAERLKQYKEFKKTHREFIQSFFLDPEARLRSARSESRKQFGVPMAQVGEQVMRRQIRKPPQEPRQISPPAAPDEDPTLRSLREKLSEPPSPKVKPPEEEPPDDPPIGRRSPRKPPGK